MPGFKQYGASDVLTNYNELASAVNISLLYPYLPEGVIGGDKFDTFLKERFAHNENSRSQFHMAVQQMLKFSPPAELVGYQSGEICAWLGNSDYPSKVLVRVPHELYSGMYKYFKIDVAMSRSGVRFNKVTSESITDAQSHAVKKGVNAGTDPRPLFAKVKSGVNNSLNELTAHVDVAVVADQVHKSGYIPLACLDIAKRVKEGRVSPVIAEKVLKHLQSGKPYRVGYSIKALAANETFTAGVGQNETPTPCMIKTDAMQDAVQEVQARLPIPVAADHGGQLKDIIGAVHAVEFDVETGVVSLPVIEFHKNDASVDVCEMLDKGVNVQISVVGGGSGDVGVYEKHFSGGLVRSNSFVAGHGQVSIKEYDRFKMEGFDLVRKGAVAGVNFQIL